MNHPKNLKNTLLNESKTLLGVGPMSVNLTDVVIDISNKYSIPIQLIASRRQVESKEYGSGYVNNWSTEEFSNYVKSKDNKSMIFLSRDHGGPWQNYLEVEDNLNLDDALENAKNSFKTDILNDFKFIHIDPSVDIHGEVSNKQIMDRVLDLYGYCIELAKEHNKEIFIEVGTEEQKEGLNQIDEVKENIDTLKSYCKENGYPLPYFYVVQNGSKVKETENTGIFQNLNLKNFNNDDGIIQINKITDLCLSESILPKAHNSDYLNYETSSIYPKINLKGGHIAPEFGVLETRIIVLILQKYNLLNELNEFLEISHKSNKWQKWLKKDSTATDFDKAIIAGHYIFSNQSFIELKEKIDYKLKKSKLNLDNEIKSVLQGSINNYLSAYGWNI